MRFSVKKAAAVILVSSILLPLPGCSKLFISEEEMLNVADSYAQALSECNVPKIARATDASFEEDREYWERKLSFSTYSGYSDREARVLGAIADSITYSVNEDSVDSSKKGNVFVDVTFTMADWEKLADHSEPEWSSDLAEEAGTGDTVDLVIPVEFTKENDQWLCANYHDVFETLYAFTFKDYNIRVPLDLRISGYTWYGVSTYGTNYVNTNEICMTLNVDMYDPISYNANDDEFEGFEDVYYTVECHGQEIYRGTGTYMGTLNVTDVPDYADPSGRYLAAGEYLVTFYDGDDTEIISATAYVDVETDSVEIEPYLRWWYTSNAVENEEDGYSLTVDYGGVTEDPIYINTEIIEAQVQYHNGYAYWDGYATLEYEGEIIYYEEGVESLMVTSYDVFDDSCIDQETYYFLPGEYTVTFYDGDDNLVSSASCTVELRAEKD